jgi:CelD/BcsL family acetyltransferase involved in cellulose biosynthesis
MSCLKTATAAMEEDVVSAPIRVDVVSSYQALLDLGPAWGRLAEAAELDHPFLEHDWIRTWWECCGAGYSLNILALYAGDEVIAIAPLVLSRVKMWGITLRRLGFFYNDHVPRADFLIAQRHSEAYRAIWSHLLENRNWDLLQLCQLPADSETLTQLRALAAGNGCPSGAWPSGASPYIELSTSWPEYCDGLPAKHRSNLRNRFKRLNQTGPVDLETITAKKGLKEVEVDEAVAAGFSLEAAAWKGNEGTAISNDPDLVRFYTTLAQRAAKNGWLQLHFLNTGSRRIAFDYSLTYKNRLFLLKLGYDPGFSAYSPSNLLLYLVLQASFGQGADVYDFLGQTAEWKRNWTQEATEHYWLYIFRGSGKGRLMHFLKFRFVPFLKVRFVPFLKVRFVPFLKVRIVPFIKDRTSRGKR